MQTRTRRSFGKEITGTDWEVLIKECLTGAGTNKWGCLNRKNRLFRIATFNSITIPSKIVDKMVHNGMLVMHEGYYKYTSRRKKRLFT